ncbi:hypothetical protein M407DRAFT_73349 [Tulasnella calospora MUT 4182]|uniref:Glucanase n=1 Tax=Tulasnella calospora MUT 4182 TaxID=1051891 RepID=A0A0C3M131_9AGAM|nr:hypothetical protein M407DRAFT_73349 [Tulasnella calospora MUT 4182]
MYPRALLFSAVLVSFTNAQHPGTLVAEVHPSLTWSKCTSSGCITQSGKVVLDANWRWYHTSSGYTNCYTGNTWDASLCPDPLTCTANCVIEGVNYVSDFGISTSSNAVRLKWMQGSTVGARIYLLQDDNTYQIFKPLAQEITFDVDLSTLPCGMAAIAQLSAMAADGGISTDPGNTAGAKYGVGYCNAHCPRDVKWIKGQANLLGWMATSSTSGTGNYGACCNEMDLFEGNSISSDFAAHSCSSTVTGLYRCSGTACGTTASPYGGVCDPLGCEYNSYRNGVTTFYGPSKTINTNQKFTVVTQFITNTGTATGTLTEIRRLWVQNGAVIQNASNASVNVAGIPTGNSISAGYCTGKESAFGDPASFEDNGGLGSINEALNRGMILTFSIWDDPAAHLLWLDSNYPASTSTTQPGVARGTCLTTSGDPAWSKQMNWMLRQRSCGFELDLSDRHMSFSSGLSAEGRVLVSS